MRRDHSQALKKRRLHRLITSLRKPATDYLALFREIDAELESDAAEVALFRFTPEVYRVFMLQKATAAGYRGIDETEFFPFTAEDVAVMLRWRHGQSGIWYQLHDGRVFDADGRACDPRHLKTAE